MTPRGRCFLAVVDDEVAGSELGGVQGERRSACVGRLVVDTAEERWDGVMVEEAFTCPDDDREVDQPVDVDEAARPADRHLRPHRHRPGAVRVLAAMAETERENIREATLEGLNAAARKGHHGGRPPVITDDMLHTVLRRRARGESVESIRPDLIIPPANARGAPRARPASTGRPPSTRSGSRYPEAVDQAHADFASLQTSD